MEPKTKEKNKKRLNFKLWDPARDKRVFKFIIIVVIFLAAILTIKEEILWDAGYYDELLPGEEAVNDTAAETCNVQGIELHGELVTYISPADLDADGNLLADKVASQDIDFAIQESEKNNDIKAIVLEVDSYGGSPTAAEEISNALKAAKKPTVALIREGGVSAAYWAATGADIIFASKNSDVGSIAVTMSYLDYAKQDLKEGFTYNELTSGKFKDTGNPDKTLTSEEKQLLMRDIEIVHRNFIKAVSENRSLDIAEVESLADGSTMLGEMALQNGLIDKIGGMAEVKDYLKEKIGQAAEICW